MLDKTAHISTHNHLQEQSSKGEMALALRTIAARLRYLRQKRGWTAEEVSRFTGIPETTIFTWETTENVPPADKLAILAKLYGVSQEWIVTGKDNAENLSRQWPHGFAVLSRGQKVLTDEEKDLYTDLMAWLLRNKDKLPDLHRSLIEEDNKQENNNKPQQ